jgi:hypothetical protein
MATARLLSMVTSPSVRAWAELHMNSYLHAVGIQFPDEIKSRDWTEVTMTWRKEGY